MRSWLTFRNHADTFVKQAFISYTTPGAQISPLYLEGTLFVPWRKNSAGVRYGILQTTTL